MEPGRRLRNGHAPCGPAASVILSAMSAVEREFKLRIPDAERFRALLARFEGVPRSRVRQVNHFFDTDARALRAARLALRLREEDGRFALALKGPQLSGSGALAEREEVEREIEPRAAESVLVGERCPLATLAALAPGALVREARARVGDPALRRLGSFENERLRLGPLAFPPGSAGPALVFELDETRFPDGSVEHELELELPAGADDAAIEQELRALFASLGLPFESAPSKAARFFGILERMRGPT